MSSSPLTPLSLSLSLSLSVCVCACAGNLPDYAMLIIGANHGLIGMCKEHMGIALALKIPIFFVITKIDICPEHIFENTMKSLQAILKK